MIRVPPLRNARIPPPSPLSDNERVTLLPDTRFVYDFKK